MHVQLSNQYQLLLISMECQECMHGCNTKSWLIFDLLEVKVQWMQYLVDHWDTQEEFRRFFNMVNKMIVVNDLGKEI